MQAQRTVWERDRQDLLAGQLRQHVEHEHKMALQLQELAFREKSLKMSTSQHKAELVVLREQNAKLRKALHEVLHARAPDLLEGRKGGVGGTGIGTGARLPRDGTGAKGADLGGVVDLEASDM